MKEAVREHYIFGRAIPRDVQFYEYAGQWYKTKKEPFISNASRSYYKTCFVKHLLPRFGMQHMKAITAVQIQESSTVSPEPASLRSTTSSEP